MNARAQAAVALAAVTVVAVPLTVTATTAAWSEAEWVHGEVGTSSLDCTGGGGFASLASGRFLSGRLLGLDLDAIAELEQLSLVIDGTGAATVSPGGAIDLGSAPPDDYVYANPFDVSLLSTVDVDLSGFAVGLPGAALGAANQYGRVGTDGTAAGASGLINDSGAVLVSDSTPSSQLPARARIGLSSVLPPVAGIADVDLEVGAVAASSQLDGCALLREQLWGESASGAPVVRDYGIAGLGLHLDAPVVTDLVGTVAAGIDSLGDAVRALAGPGGLIATGIGSQVRLALPGVLTTSIGGDVSISGFDLAGAASALLTTPLTDGVVTIDLASGAVTVDLDALLPSLNDAPPNTEVVLNDTVLNPVVARAGALLDNWATQIVDTLRNELRDASVVIALRAVVAAPGVSVPPVLTLPGLDVLRADIGFAGTLGQLLDGAATLTVSAQVAGAGGPIATLLGALGLPTVTSLLGTVSALGPALLAEVTKVVTATVTTALTTLGATIAGGISRVVTALGGVIDALPSVVSLTVNVQPDQPGAPPGSTFIPATGAATAEYAVSALRIGLVDAVGGVAAITFATATAGPVTAP